MKATYTVKAPVADVRAFLPAYLRKPAPEGTLSATVEKAAKVDPSQLQVEQTGSGTFRATLTAGGKTILSTYRLSADPQGTRIDVDVTSDPAPSMLERGIEKIAAKALKGDIPVWESGFVDFIAQQKQVAGQGLE
jgi:hypothetical protein